METREDFRPTGFLGTARLTRVPAGRLPSVRPENERFGPT